MFDVFGLYNGVFAMSDRQTGTVWTHLDGIALKGSLAGERLPIIPMIHTTWEDWVAEHPDTTVLDNDTPYRSQYSPVRIGEAGIGPEFARSLLNQDNRLPENAIVIGVTGYGKSRAYPLDALPPGTGVVNDVLGGEAIVVFHQGRTTTGLAFARMLNGVTLTFQTADGVIQDVQTGSTWNMEGVATDGPMAGSSLTFVTSFITEWYGWSAFHPSTTIHS